jgi:folate-binding protein YgfZ
MPSPFVAALPSNALIAVTGDDATAFLHGQFTNDVEALVPGGSQWNGWCSPKGRLLATFLLVKRADGYLLVLPREIAPAIAKRLAMFVLRSKVKIADVTASHALFGGRGRDELDGVKAAPGAQPYAHGDLWLLVAPPDTSVGVTGTEDDWRRALIAAGVITIVAATQDQFVPQMANFELVGGVNFKKGCYPGQEIVARTQYRGILKRRMARAHLPAGIGVQPGQSVYGTAFGDQAAGMVANAAPAENGGTDLLVVAQLESLQASDLRLAAPDGPPLAIVSHPASAAA